MTVKPADEPSDSSDPADQELDRLLLEAFDPLSAPAGLRTRVELPVQPRGEAGPSLSERLKHRFGVDLDPAVSLGVDEDSAVLPSELMDRLRAQGPHGTRYRMVGEVARGGMGVVFKVYDDDLRRTLAMKVVLDRNQTSSREAPAVDVKTLGRFLEEAQVTGQLDHPGILPVHELGLASDGRVYFTMRLVKGVDLRTIYEYVHAGKDGWNQTRALGVLLKVCEAMSYAHDKGVIHRDLKPANVMVGKFGEVYVMDWGLARVFGREDKHDLRIRPQPVSTQSVHTDRRGTREETPDSPLITMDGDVVGTPVYMPPEQARGRLEQVGPRSDVYSLGAMLYHLLTGQMPFVPTGARASQHSILMRLLEGPPKPLHEVAPLTPPELAAICEKAMAREPAQRYADTQALGEDLRAYLEHRVVGAYEVGAWAEACKWVQRNKPLAASLAAAAAILVVGLVVSTTQYWRAEDNFEVARANETRANANAEQAKQEAERANTLAASEAEQRKLADTRRAEADVARAESEAKAAELQQVSDFQASMLQKVDVELMGLRLREDVLKEARASMERSKRSEQEVADRMGQIENLLAGTNFTNAAVSSLERNVLQPALEAIEKDFAEQPLVQAQLLAATGKGLIELGRYESARRAYEEVWKLHVRILGDDDQNTITSANDLGLLFVKLGKLSEADPLLHDALDRRRRIQGDDHPYSIVGAINLAELLSAQGKLNEAVPILRDALARSLSIQGEDHPITLKGKNNLANLLQAQGNLSEAEPLARDVLERSRRILGEDHPDTIDHVGNLAVLLHTQDKLSEALPLTRDALERNRRIHGDDHPRTLKREQNLASLLFGQGNLSEAEPLMRDALEKCSRILGEDHPAAMRSAGELAALLRAQGKLSEAEPLLLHALERSRRILGEGHSQTLDLGNNLAVLFRTQSKLSEAESLFRDTLERRRLALGEDHSSTITSEHNLAQVLQDQGKLSEAEPLWRDALARKRRTLGDDHTSTINSEYGLISLLREGGELSEVEPLLRNALERDRRTHGNDHSDTIISENNLAKILQDQGKLSEAEPLQRDALERGRRVWGEDDVRTLFSEGNLATLLQAQGKLGEAETLLRNAYERVRGTLGDEDRRTLLLEGKLAALQLAQDRWPEAEGLFLDCEQRCMRVGAGTEKTLKSAREGLVKLYETWEKAAPGHGYAAKAAEYRAKLASSEK